MNRALFVLIVLFASVLVYQWRPSNDVMQVANHTPSEIDAPAKTEKDAAGKIGLAPFVSFDEVVQRPLFIEGRRPPAEEEDSPEEVPKSPARPVKRPAIDLTATLIIDNQTQAVFRAAGRKPELQKLKLGEEIEGWIVSEIQSKRVTLVQGGVEEVFLLREYKKVPLPAIPEKTRVNKAEPKEVGDTKGKAAQPPKK